MPWKILDEPGEDEIRALQQEYRRKARFLVDESAGREVALLLEGLGYNTKYAAELGLLGRSDEEVFAVAWREQRIIVTHDYDFLDDRRFPPHRNPGIIVVGPGSDGRNDEALVRCLLTAIQIAGRIAGWFRGKKLDFSSHEEFSIKSPEGRQRYKWTANMKPMFWDGS